MLCVPNSHGNEKEIAADDILHKMQEAFGGFFIANCEFEPKEAAEWVASHKADAITFGRMFLANPDLPARIAAGGPYNEPDRNTFYGGDHRGYTDYPTLIQTNNAL